MIGLIISGAVIAQDITVINAGSRAGATFMESKEIADVLAKKYNVNFVNPGNGCVAQSIVKKTKTPILFIWDTSLDAQAITNSPECQLDFHANEIIKSDDVAWVVCSINNKDHRPLTSSGGRARIGFNNPRSLFVETVEAINKAFQTSHTPVFYESGGAALVTALGNGEIDYGIMSQRAGNRAAAQGVTCGLTFGPKDHDSMSSVAALAKNPDTKLVRWTQFVYVGKNFDPAVLQDVKTLLRTETETPGTPLNNLHKNLPNSAWDRTPDQRKSSWKSSVNGNLIGR